MFSRLVSTSYPPSSLRWLALASGGFVATSLLAAEAIAADEALPGSPRAELGESPVPQSSAVTAAPAAPRPPRPPPRRAKKPEVPAPPRDAEAAAGASASVESRLHDRYYVRLALGGNYGRMLVQTNRLSQPDVKIVGLGQSFEVWAGRTLPTGFVLGVTLSGALLSSSAAELSTGGSSDAHTLALLFGAFLDTYLDPKQGFHFGGSVAAVAAMADTEPAAQRTRFRGAGFGMSAFAGYDAWIGPEVSLGGMLRLGGAITRGDEDGVTKQGTLYGAQLLATVLYH